MTKLEEYRKANGGTIPRKLKPTTIKLDDDFSVSWDRYNWLLFDYQVNNDSGKRPKQPRTTYHGKLSQVLADILERRLGAANGPIEKLLEQLDTLATQMQKCSDSLEESLHMKGEKI